MNRALFALFTIFACAGADNIRDRDYYVGKFYDWMKTHEKLAPRVRYLSHQSIRDDSIGHINYSCLLPCPQAHSMHAFP